MRIIFLLVVTLGLTSCQEEIEVISSKAGSYYFKPVDAGVISAAEVKWPVGPLRRQRVSKGIRLRVRFPKFKNRDLQELVDKRQADSWLVRVRKRGFGSSEVLGRVYVPLYTSGGSRGSFRLSQRGDAIFLIYYAAAATSTRFASFMCPAFNHRKKIGAVSVESGFERARPIKVAATTEKRFLYEAKALEYEPPIFNAGSDMQGSYVFEVALYSSVRKRLLSSFTPLDAGAKVTAESKVDIKGCENYKIPAPGEDNDKIKQFKFGG